MEIHVTEQASVFLQALFLGGVLGCIYDVFRITRLAFVLPSLLVLLEDLLFFLMSSIILFNYLLQSSSGQIRYFILVGVALGWTIYYFTAGRAVMALASRSIHLIKSLIRLILSPFVWVLRQLEGMTKTVGKALRHLTGKLKIGLKLRILMMYNKTSKQPRPGKGMQDEKSKGKS